MIDQDKKDRDNRRRDLIETLKTPQGRRVYWRLMAKCGAFREQFTQDTNKAYFFQGKRSVGLEMYHDLLDADPDIYIKMLHENKAKDTRAVIKTTRYNKVKTEEPLNIDSPILPNTGTEKSNRG